MIANRAEARRLGTILPLMALLLVCLCGFTALSVEVATISTIKTQCQNAADSAALAGARTLNGGTTSSAAQAQSNALAAASANSSLGLNSSGSMAMVAFKSSEVSSTCGTYHYNTSTQTFGPAYTLQSGENYNLTSATVQRQIKNTFFAVDGGMSNAATTPTITASAVAAHRPRDVAIVLDFSGSMNNETDLWNCESYLGSYNNMSNNSDPIVPSFGHFSSSAASLVSPSASPYGTSNMTQSVNGLPALATSFYATNPTITPSISAFSLAPTSYGSKPLGDIPLTQIIAGSSAYAQTLNQLLNTSYTTSYQTGSYGDYWEGAGVVGPYGTVQGYNASYTFYPPGSPSGQVTPGVPGFSGYVQGPGYWGKTFFQWPPDPAPSKDWRQLYFTDSSNNPVVNNTTLWDSSGNWLAPWNGSTNYHINYKAILNWIKAIGPNPFPSTLTAGGITYYTAIPTDVPASAYDFSQPNYNITNADQRFWKEYIDYALGWWTDPTGYQWNPGTAAMSYGPDYNWGTVQITAKPTGTPPNGYKLASMNFNDNPLRPRHRMWFGPMTMMQYIQDAGLNPGTARDTSTYSAKLGIASVLSDIQQNHPNDEVALLFYSRPQFSDEVEDGSFNQPIYSLNRNYSSMINSLWYPPNYGGTIRPWDPNGLQTPCASHDSPGSTATEYGLMQAYNQFSGSSTLSSSNSGGLGRVGAKKLVILETDGMANVSTNASFTSNGSNSYYNIVPGQSIQSVNYNQTALLQVAQAICNTGTGAAGNPNSVVANAGYPGFSTSTKPVTIQTIAFGVVFQLSSTTQQSSVSLLQGIASIGGTVFPSSPSDPTNGYKYCIGTLSQRVSLLQQAFSNILNDGDSVSIIQ